VDFGGSGTATDTIIDNLEAGVAAQDAGAAIGTGIDAGVPDAESLMLERWMHPRMRRRMATALQTRNAALMPACPLPAATTRPVWATTAEPSVTVRWHAQLPDQMPGQWLGLRRQRLQRVSVLPCLHLLHRKWKSVLR